MKDVWLLKVNEAVERFYKVVPFSSHMIKNLQLSHIDEVGYWFTYELVNDSRSQTFAVKHTEL